MSFEAGSIKGKMGLDNEPTIEAMREVRAEATMMRERIDSESAAAERSMKDHMGGALEDLKEQFGRRSEMGELMHTAMGGGALFAVNEAASIMKDVTEKALELKEALDAGKISASEMNLKLGESIPIIGSAVSAGENVAEMISGQKAEIEAMNREIKLGGEIFLAERDGVRELTAELERSTEAARRYATERANLGAKPGEAAINLINEGELNRVDTQAERMQAKVDAARAKLDHAADLQAEKMSPLQAKANAIDEQKSQTRNPMAWDKLNKESQAAHAALNKETEEWQRKVKAADDAEARTKESFWKAEGEAEKTAAAKIAAAREGMERDRIESARRAAQELNDVIQEGNAARMRMEGHAFEADKAMRELRLNDEKENIVAGMREKLRLEHDPVQQIEIVARTNKLLDAKDNASDVDSTKAMKDHATKMADLKSETRAMELKNAHREYEAEAEQLRQSYEDKIAVAKSGEEKILLQKQEAAAMAGVLKRAMDEDKKRYENDFTHENTAQQVFRRFSFESVNDRTPVERESPAEIEKRQLLKDQIAILSKIADNTEQSSDLVWTPVPMP